MSENLLKLFRGKVEDIEGANRHANWLFLQIEKHHGEEEARRIFARLGKPPGRRELQERQGFDVLQRYDTMEPRPNVERLAQQLADETGRTEATAKTYINEQRRKRRTMIRAGNWFGPPYFGEEFKDWSGDEG